MARKTKATIEMESKEPEIIIPESVQEEATQPEPAEVEPVPVPVDTVQAGNIQAKSKVSTGNCADYPVRFPRPFDEGTVPTVVVGLVSSSTAARFGVCSCAVLEGSVNHEGFTIRFYNGDVSSRIPGFSYIAFGVVTQ